jgi:hypothetical protein
MNTFRALGSLIAFELLLMTHAVRAIEYNVPEPEQRFGDKGWLTQIGNDHGIKFKAYLEAKRLLVTEDGIYYEGTQRVEGIDGDPHGFIRWRYRALCAVPPNKKNRLSVGLWFWDSKSNYDPNNFVEVDPANASPANAARGWYNLWWAVCREQAKSFF